MKHLLIILAITAASLQIRADDIANTANELLLNIHAVLPNNWTATYCKTNAWLEVVRTEPVLSLPIAENLSGEDKPEPGAFVFAFRVHSVVSPLQYQQMSVANSNIQMRLNEMYADLCRKHISHKFDSFLPSTDEDKRLVARYEALKHSLRERPTFHYKNISLSWNFNSPEAPMIYVVDPIVREECSKVSDKVLSLLTRY